MSENINGIVIIREEPPQQCDVCDKIAELRPYGKNGACICYECGLKDEETTNKMMGIILFGDKEDKQCQKKKSL